MFYSWTDIENLGYKNIKDFAREETRRQDYEGAVVTPEGIEIIRKQHLSDFKPTPSIKKKIVQCKIFPNIGLESEEIFNNFLSLQLQLSQHLSPQSQLSFFSCVSTGVSSFSRYFAIFV